MLTAAVFTYVTKKQYRSSVKIEIKPAGRDLNPTGTERDALNTRISAQFLNTEFEKIKSGRVIYKVVDSLKLDARWGISRDAAYDRVRSIVSTNAVRMTDLTTISVTYTNMDEAREIAEAVVRSYKAYRQEGEKDFAEININILKRQLDEQIDLREELRKTVDEIILQNNILPRNAEDGGIGVQIEATAKEAEKKYIEMEQNVALLQNQLVVLKEKSGEELLRSVSGLNLPNSIVTTLYPEYLKQKRDIDALRGQGYGENHEAIKSGILTLDYMGKQLAEGVINLKETLATNLNLAETALDKQKVIKEEKKKEAVETLIKMQRYYDADRDLKEQEKRVEVMREGLSRTILNSKAPSSPIEIHEDAVASPVPVSPNIPLNLSVGAVVGLVFGLGIAFLLEYLDTSVKSLDDVERYLQVPVLAVIPKDVGVLHTLSGMSPDAEAYRILRTNIEFNRKNPDDNSITVVSGGAGEGKSTTLVNLAYICAQGGYTTLMIDADLRRPRLHTFFELNNSIGLTNYLTTDTRLEDVILQTAVDNLFFMPSGILPADAAGILNSRRMSELIQDVKQRFDLVLVDSPPILGVSDASVLASEVDLTMIVVQHRKLPRTMLVRVKQAVENVGGKVIGVVLNNVDVRSDSQYQYYTSYYTYYAPAESQNVNVKNLKTNPVNVAVSPRNDSELY